MGQTAEELRHQLDQQRDMIGRDLVAIGDRVSPGRMMERRRTAMRQSLGRARTAVMGAADGASSSASSAASSVGDTVSNVGSTLAGAPDALRSQTQGNPFAAGLVAFGAGALVGTLLPKTRYEEQAVEHVQPALESAAAELGQEAKGVAETVQEHAGEAAERLKDSAQGAAESVKGEASHAAETVKGDATQAAEQTKARAQSAVEAAKPR